MSAGKCVTTGKTQYETRREARQALNALAKRRIGSCERSAYKCPFCDYWHISRQPERTVRMPRMEPAKRWRWNGEG